MKILALNPGGNSLKAELVDCRPGQRYAFEGQALFRVSIEGIGKAPELSILKDKEKVATEAIAAADYAQATSSFLQWWTRRAASGQFPATSDVDAIAIRVVHGGQDFDRPVRMDSSVIERIVQLERLAPLHNKSSVEVFEPARRHFARTPIYAVFDTAFHRTMPDHVSRYAIPVELAERHHVRRYGFHGVSHRYLLERYAHLAETEPARCNIVTFHLESGCSATAIREGTSVDTTMGLTPLEGLMMGTRCGDIDPSVVPLLMREEGLTVDEVMEILNKHSGLKGISEESLDTRVLMKEYDSNPKAKLAMDMFVYRVRKAAGALVAALGSVDAIIFGGGIGENGVFLRRQVCDGLRGFGLVLNEESNEGLIDKEGPLSASDSRIKAWVIPTQEGLQMAHEACCAVEKYFHAQ